MRIAHYDTLFLCLLLFRALLFLPFVFASFLSLFAFLLSSWSTLREELIPLSLPTHLKTQVMKAADLPVSMRHITHNILGTKKRQNVQGPITALQLSLWLWSNGSQAQFSLAFADFCHFWLLWVCSDLLALFVNLFTTCVFMKCAVNTIKLRKFGRWRLVSNLAHSIRQMRGKRWKGEPSMVESVVRSQKA